jgi:lysophospholipase L1-like esterase
MGSRVVLALSVVAAFVIVVTSAWTINEVGKNNRAISNLSELMQAAEAERKQAIAAPTVGHEHSKVREIIIDMQLARAKNPIVFLGDSLTEVAVLPRSICGHAVVNAGIGGAAVDQLQEIVHSLLDGRSPVLVVLAIGTNDAYAAPGREQAFRASYVKLLQTLSLVTPRIVVANIPPIDPKGALTIAAGIDASLVDRFNLILPKIADDVGASFVDVNEAVSIKGTAETIDGIHLGPQAYDLWDAAMLVGIKKALDCSS